MQKCEIIGYLYQLGEKKKYIVHPYELHCPRGEIEQEFVCKDMSVFTVSVMVCEREREIKRE